MQPVVSATVDQSWFPTWAVHKSTSSKMRGKDNITIGTWNTRTLRAAGKLQELPHEMDRYTWNTVK